MGRTIGRKIIRKCLRGLCLFGLCVIIPTAITFAVTGVVEEQEPIQSITGKTVCIQYAHATKVYDVEEFIVMVLAERLKLSEQPELLKAESILVRTNIYRLLGDAAQIAGEDCGEMYLTKQKMKQQWKEEYNRKYQLIQDAVNATRGQVLLYQGMLIDAHATQVSSGKTLSGEQVSSGTAYAYLMAVSCPDDLQSTQYLQVKSISKKEIVQKLTNKYDAIHLSKENLFNNIQIVAKAEDGTILKLQAGNVILTGMEFAAILQLPSANFSIIEDGNSLKFTTKGVGDNMGVSLYTANLMAELGNTCDAILQKFYTGVQIAQINNECK